MSLTGSQSDFYCIILTKKEYKKSFLKKKSENPLLRPPFSEELIVSYLASLSVMFSSCMPSPYIKPPRSHRVVVW